MRRRSSTHTLVPWNLANHERTAWKQDANWMLYLNRWARLDTDQPCYRLMATYSGRHPNCNTPGYWIHGQRWIYANPSVAVTEADFRSAELQSADFNTSDCDLATEYSINGHMFRINDDTSEEQKSELALLIERGISQSDDVPEVLLALEVTDLESED